MKESDITDEQILEQKAEILQNPQLRKCCQCAYSDEQCTRCFKTGNAIATWMYAGLCPHYETNDERIIRKSRERLRQIEKEERKMNVLLTMCLNSVDIALLFLEDIEARLEKEYVIADKRGTGDKKVRQADRNWIRQLKMALKEMKRHSEGLKRQYNHFIIPIFNKVFFDKETKEYNVDSYDDHTEDTFQLAELLLRYFDGTYNNRERAVEFKEAIKTILVNSTFEESDYKRYNFRRQ